MTQPKPNPSTSKAPNSTRPPSIRWAKYTGFGLQLALGIALGAWGGHRLDQWAQWTWPAGMICGSLLALYFILYTTIKQLNHRGPCQRS